MAVITSTLFTKGGSGVAANSQQTVSTVNINLKVADFLTAGGVTTDQAKVLTIPARTAVEIVSVNNLTALSMGSSPAVSVGDSGSATLYVNASSVVTTDTIHTVATASKVYMAADTLLVRLTGGTLATGTVQLVVRLTDLSSNQKAVAS